MTRPKRSLDTCPAVISLFFSDEQKGSHTVQYHCPDPVKLEFYGVVLLKLLEAIHVGTVFKLKRHDSNHNSGDGSRDFNHQAATLRWSVVISLATIHPTLGYKIGQECRILAAPKKKNYCTLHITCVLLLLIPEFVAYRIVCTIF
nr:hypothetical protein CFP56_07232 [Quercus suber]